MSRETLGHAPAHVTTQPRSVCSVWHSLGVPLIHERPWRVADQDFDQKKIEPQQNPEWSETWPCVVPRVSMERAIRKMVGDDGRGEGVGGDRCGRGRGEQAARGGVRASSTRDSSDRSGLPTHGHPRAYLIRVL